MSVQSPQTAAMLQVALPVSVEIGRCTLRLDEILNLTTGSLVRLDRLAGAPVDLLVNDTLIGRGEIVALDQHYGLSVTEIILASPTSPDPGRP